MRGSSYVLFVFVSACSNTAGDAPAVRRDAGMMDLAPRLDLPDVLDAPLDVAQQDAPSTEVATDVRFTGVPYTSRVAGHRLYVIPGATMVVTADKVRYGWGDYLGELLGYRNAPPVRRVERIDLDEETYDITFQQGVLCQRRRVGGGPVQCWGLLNPPGLATREPQDRPVRDTDHVQPDMCASRSDGVWCWRSWHDLDLPRPTVATRRYSGRFCTFIPGMNRPSAGDDALCGYDCENHRISCAGAWFAFGPDGEILTLDTSDDFVWNYPIDDVTAIGRDTSVTMFVVRSDGSLWCRGFCGGEMVGTSALPHEDFRQIRGLPPVRFAQGTVPMPYPSGQESFACALLRNGTVTCWGGCAPYLGALCARSRTPIMVENVGGLTNVIEIGMSTYHACALTADDQVWCWGYNALHAVDPTDDTANIWEPVRIPLPTRP
jgi:hypothetical protein